jgi:DNA-binding IclR family transcriptional regulator
VQRANEAGTVDRVIDLLTVIAESEGLLSIQRLAEALALPRSTIHRLLEKLSVRDLVVHERGLRRYRIGPEFYRLGSLVSRQPITAIALPLLKELSESIGEACVLGVLLPHARRMIFAAKVDTDKPLRYRIDLDKPLALAQGASGWAILAYLPPDQIDAVIAEHLRSESLTRQLRQAQQLRKQLERVRAEGFAQSHGSRIPGAVGFAAPVFSAGKKIFGSLCITIPEQRYDPRGCKLIVAGLLRTAAKLSGIVDTTDTAPVPTRTLAS